MFFLDLLNFLWEKAIDFFVRSAESLVWQKLLIFLLDLLNFLLAKTIDLLLDVLNFLRARAIDVFVRSSEFIAGKSY